MLTGLGTLLICSSTSVLSIIIHVQCTCKRMYFDVQEFHGVDGNFTKLFRLAQLTIEYLLVSVNIHEHGRALSLESRVSWVQIPPEAAHFSLEFVSGVVVLCCIVLLCMLSRLIMYTY